MNGTKIGQGWRLSMPPCPSPLRLRRLHRHGRRCEDRRFLPHHRSRLRSEEHTSELQSLMRNSYAVFCLKKKKPKNTAHCSQCHRTYEYHTIHTSYKTDNDTNSHTLHNDNQYT